MWEDGKGEMRGVGGRMGGRVKYKGEIIGVANSIDHWGVTETRDMT